MSQPILPLGPPPPPPPQLPLPLPRALPPLSIPSQTTRTNNNINNNNNNNEVVTPVQPPPLPFLDTFGTPNDNNPNPSRSPSPGAALRRKGKNFLSKEDDQLARSWIEICHDPILGTKVTSPEFWDRVRTSFVLAIPESEARTSRSLQIRWRTCERAVDRFCECVATVHARLEGTEKSWVDEINDASKLYRELYTSEFTMLSCWTILRQEPKWQEATLHRKKPKKRARVVIGDDDEGEANLSPFPMTPDLNSERRETKKIALEGHYVETPLRTHHPEILPKNDVVETCLQTIAESLTKYASVETSLRSIAESLAKIAEESEKKNRIMETATSKSFDEQIMSRPILGLYPHQRQYYELQQNRILKSLMNKMDKEADGVLCTTSLEPPTASPSEFLAETPVAFPDTNEMQ